LPPGTNAKFVRLTGDEASVTLNFTQTISWIALMLNVMFSQIFGVLAKPFRITRLRRPFRDRLLFFLATSWFTFAVLVLVITSNEEITSGAAILLFWMATVAIGGALGIPMVFFTVSAVLLSFNWLLSLTFGRMPFFSGGLLQPAVESTPPGLWSLDHVTWKSYGHSVRKPLWRHSNPYGEPRVIADVIKWLQDETR
jgi:hypothetical protein